MRGRTAVATPSRRSFGTLYYRFRYFTIVPDSKRVLNFHAGQVNNFVFPRNLVYTRVGDFSLSCIAYYNQNRFLEYV